MARDRFTARAQSRKRRKYVWALVIVLFVAVLGAVAWAAWSTSWLAAKQVRVVGIQHVSETEVVAAAEVPLGLSLLQIDTGPIEDRVAALLIVNEASVAREFPNTIVVTVAERQAVAWLTRGGEPWAVDVKGVDYRQLKSKPKHIPELKVKRSDKSTVQAAAEVAADLAEVDPELLAQVKSISAKSKDSIELRLKGGKSVAWGDSEQTEQKARTLAALLSVSAGHYDVSAPERPTTRE